MSGMPSSVKSVELRGVHSAMLVDLQVGMRLMKVSWRWLGRVWPRDLRSSVSRYDDVWNASICV